MNSTIRCWAIIPAAGAGTRMELDKPKQYLKLREKYVLEYSIQLFCKYEKISAVVVVLADADPYWSSTGLENNDRVITTIGGVERCHSVLNGLHALKDTAGPDDWVLVHDAARPCLQSADLDKMILVLEDHPVGGILANDARPAEFIYDNLAIETNVIEAARRTGVTKLLLLGSSCIYPRLAEQPMSEAALLTGPLEPTNQWYAVAKIAGIKLC